MESQEKEQFAEMLRPLWGMEGLREVSKMPLGPRHPEPIQEAARILPSKGLREWNWPLQKHATPPHNLPSHLGPAGAV